MTSTPQKAEEKVRTHAHGSEELLVVATFQTSREVLNLSPAGNLGHVALMTRRKVSLTLLLTDYHSTTTLSNTHKSGGCLQP